MTIFQHPTLAEGRWNQMSLVEQMANIGSEVERALKWREKNNTDYSMKAFHRSLELLDLSLDCPANRLRLKEISRCRSVLVDYFAGTNDFKSSEKSWRNYFLQFAYAARRGK